MLIPKPEQGSENTLLVTALIQQDLKTRSEQMGYYQISSTKLNIIKN